MDFLKHLSRDAGLAPHCQGYRYLWDFCYGCFGKACCTCCNATTSRIERISRVVTLCLARLVIPRTFLTVSTATKQICHYGDRRLSGASHEVACGLVLPQQVQVAFFLQDLRRFPWWGPHSLSGRLSEWSIEPTQHTVYSHRSFSNSNRIMVKQPARPDTFRTLFTSRTAFYVVGSFPEKEFGLILLCHLPCREWSRKNIGHNQKGN